MISSLVPTFGGADAKDDMDVVRINKKDLLLEYLNGWSRHYINVESPLTTMS